MHVSQVTELYSSSQFSESLILGQIFSSNEDVYLSAAGKVRKGCDTLVFGAIKPQPFQLSEDWQEPAGGSPRAHTWKAGAR